MSRFYGNFFDAVQSFLGALQTHGPEEAMGRLRFCGFSEDVVQWIMASTKLVTMGGERKIEGIILQFAPPHDFKPLQPPPEIIRLPEPDDEDNPAEDAMREHRRLEGALDPEEDET